MVELTKSKLLEFLMKQDPGTIPKPNGTRVLMPETQRSVE